MSFLDSFADRLFNDFIELSPGAQRRKLFNDYVLKIVLVFAVSWFVVCVWLGVF